MGEVYKARDTRLDRTVAVKVLPEHIAKRDDSRARFEREARAVASLNHPKICTLHDIGPGYMVMEFIEGETLAARIEKGPLPVEQAIGFATQIADALDRAHRAGVTHRDVKPGNIMLTRDGVKVLDFGLAKSAVSDTSLEATRSASLTVAGTVLGTPQYMPPEQFEGKEADARADIWAFGAVLYEMVTGQKAFQGKTYSSLVGSILSAEPEPFTPVWLDRLVRRCLQKDPEDRWQSMRDVVLDLRTPPQAEQAVALLKSTRWPWIAATVSTLAFFAAGVGWYSAARTEPQLAAIATTLLPPDDAEFEFGNPYAMPAISPDGTRIVYGAKGRDGKQQLWLRRLDSPTAQLLPGTADAATPFWSPDSRWVGFGQNTTLRKIDIQGGPPVAITEMPGALRGGSWNSQGVIIFGAVVNPSNSILRVAASGGTAVPVTAEDAKGGPGGSALRNPRHPWFLPDGRHFLYTGFIGASSGLSGGLGVYVGSLDESGKPGKRVIQASSSAVYAQGHLLYLRENTLMAHPFDTKRLETTGEAVPLAEEIPTFTTGSRIPGFAVSPAGLLLYQTGGPGTQKNRLVWKDRQGKVLGELGELKLSQGGLRISPEGKRVAAADSESSGSLGGNEDLRIYDAGRGTPSRFTFDPGRDINPVWSPDGKTLYFSSNRKGVFHLFRKASNGEGTEEMVLEDAMDKLPQSVSPDGKLLLYQRRGAQRGSELWVLPLSQAQGGAKAEPHLFIKAQFGEFSPDGKWVVFESYESGQAQIYAAPFPGPGGKRQISQGRGQFPRWRKDGREIFYATGEKNLVAVEVSTKDGVFEAGKVQRLFGGIIVILGGYSSGYTYDASADGQKFLVVDDGASGVARPLTLVQNWTALLRK